MPRLQDRVIIVTGGGNGIGARFCQAFAAEGARVVVADIDASAARAVAEQLEAQGGAALAVPTDVASEDSTRDLATATIARFGRIDGLVNCAAIFQRPALSRLPFDEIPIAEWERVLRVNLIGVVLCCRAVVPYMKAQSAGKILNMASTTVLIGPPLMSQYIASKAGVVGLTRALAHELGDHGITVNALAPGGTVSIDTLPETTMARLEARAQTRAIKRLETPDDLVGAAIFFTSSDSDFITGQTLVIDGGVNFL